MTSKIQRVPRVNKKTQNKYTELVSFVDQLLFCSGSGRTSKRYMLKNKKLYDVKAFKRVSDDLKKFKFFGEKGLEQVLSILKKESDSGLFVINSVSEEVLQEMCTFKFGVSESNQIVTIEEILNGSISKNVDFFLLGTGIKYKVGRVIKKNIRKFNKSDVIKFLSQFSDSLTLMYTKRLSPLEFTLNRSLETTYKYFDLPENVLLSASQILKLFNKPKDYNIIKSKVNSYWHRQNSRDDKVPSKKERLQREKEKEVKEYFQDLELDSTQSLTDHLQEIDDELEEFWDLVNEMDRQSWETKFERETKS